MPDYRYSPSYANVSEDMRQFLRSSDFGEDGEAEQERNAGDGRETPATEIEEIDVYFVRRPKKGEMGRSEDEDPPRQKRPGKRLFAQAFPAAALVSLAGNILFMVSLLVFVVLPQLTTTAYVTLIPVTKQVGVTASIVVVTGTPTSGQIPARFLPAMTLAQSQTLLTSGRGHTGAKPATGTLTFYNGQFQPITIPAGTKITGPGGVQIATDQDATIPAESQTIPPTLGQTTVSARALAPGAGGNIPTGAINRSCCAPSLLVQNTQAFSGGQDERSFSTVAKSDIDLTASHMLATLVESMQGAFQGQLQNGEAFVSQYCPPTVTSDHKIGEEAAQVRVSVAITCGAVAYKADTVLHKATTLLSTRVRQLLGPDFSVLGTPRVTVKQATVNRSTATLLLSCQAAVTYGLSPAVQQRIKAALAGKTKQQALHFLLSQQGITGSSISGIPDTKKLPDDPTRIHLLIMVEG